LSNSNISHVYRCIVWQPLDERLAQSGDSSAKVSNSRLHQFPLFRSPTVFPLARLPPHPHIRRLVLSSSRSLLPYLRVQPDAPSPDRITQLLITSHSSCIICWSDPLFQGPTQHPGCSAAPLAPLQVSSCAPSSPSARSSLSLQTRPFQASVPPEYPHLPLNPLHLALLRSHSRAQRKSMEFATQREDSQGFESSRQKPLADSVS